MAPLDREQKKIVRLIKREGRHIKDPQKRRIYEHAAVQTGLVESGLRNLDYGDADSKGWRQERASLYENPLNLRASIRRFRREFQAAYDPGERSYEVAAQVQRPREDLRGRYREEAGRAARILRTSGSVAGAPTVGYVAGVDNSDQRQLLMQQYLSERGKPGALLTLKRGLDGAQDIPASYEAPGSRSNGNRRPGQGETSIEEILAEAADFGLTVREHPDYDKVDPVHTEGSYHYKGQAGDITGPIQKLKKFKRHVRRKYGRDLEELIGNFGGGKNLKNGRKVGPGFYSGHQSHLHVADDD